MVTKEGNLICVDAKVGIDDNSLYRHPDLLALRDLSQSDVHVKQKQKNISLTMLLWKVILAVWSMAQDLLWVPWIL